MSAPRYRIPAKVIALLHERGETVESIARKVGSGRAHVTQVLANKPGRGHHTRRRLTEFLKAEELALLGWSLGGVPLNGSTRNVPNLSQTEQTRRAVPAVAPGGNAPEGPGTDGHKPLMRNRAPIHAASAMGILPAPFPPSTETKK